MTENERAAAARAAAKWELLAGLFGWIWILCSAAIFVSIVGAIFVGWSWWYVGYALVGSAVAKWLARARPVQSGSYPAALK